MNRAFAEWFRILTAIALVAALAVPASAATTPAPTPSYSVTYTITVNESGSAVWQVEYRTPLSSDDDTAAFDQYANNIDSTYLPQFQDLMERAVREAAVATSRTMKATGFTGTSEIQTSPTGTYGVILYSFTWDGFAKPGSEVIIGDAFVGGLYLAKDSTLIIRYPPGYSVKSAEPAPDMTREDLTWYGQRSFGAGEPRVILEGGGIPWMVLTGIMVVILAGAGALMIMLRRRRRVVIIPEPAAAAAPALSEDEILSLEERIIQLIRSNGGEMYQSDIVKNLGLPKSTVSTALNDMHASRLILKVKKGRENLIRLAG